MFTSVYLCSQVTTFLHLQVSILEMPFCLQMSTFLCSEVSAFYVYKYRRINANHAPTPLSVPSYLSTENLLRNIYTYLFSCLETEVDKQDIYRCL